MREGAVLYSIPSEDVRVKSPAGGNRLRNLLNRTLPLYVVGDRRLTARAQAVYCAMGSMRKTHMAEYARLLALSEETGRRVINELLDTGWAYSFRHPATGKDIVVPWMPEDVEAETAARLDDLYETAPNRGEWIAQGLLLVAVSDPHVLYNHRFHWIPGENGNRRMELDIFFPDSAVAVEFQGRQHYEEVEFESGRTNLQKQLATDRLKQLACRRRGITLIEVPDVELSYETLVQKLEGKIELLEPLRDRPIFLTLQRLAEGYAQWARRQRNTPLP